VCKSIWKSREQNNYKDLILFSVVGIHCLDKKNEVYNAFTTKQLSNTFIFQNVKFTLEEFLLIIDQLNFKKYFFDI
jgi:hypothetical protein